MEVMGIIIQDGRGKGYSAAVNSENHLKTTAVTITAEHFANHSMGLAYQVPFNTRVASKNDCFSYIQNTDDIDMVCEEIDFSTAASPCTISIKLGDSGTPTKGSAVTPVNCNGGSGKTADCTCQVGTNITGLSGGTTILNYIFNAATNDTTNFNFPQDVILPKNNVLTIYADKQASINGNLTINFHDIGDH